MNALNVTTNEEHNNRCNTHAQQEMGNLLNEKQESCDEIVSPSSLVGGLSSSTLWPASFSGKENTTVPQNGMVPHTSVSSTHVVPSPATPVALTLPSASPVVSGLNIFHLTASPYFLYSSLGATNAFTSSPFDSTANSSHKSSSLSILNAPLPPARPARTSIVDGAPQSKPVNVNVGGTDFSFTGDINTRATPSLSSAPVTEKSIVFEEIANDSLSTPTSNISNSKTPSAPTDHKWNMSAPCFTPSVSTSNRSISAPIPQKIIDPPQLARSSNSSSMPDASPQIGFSVPSVDVCPLDMVSSPSPILMLLNSEERNCTPLSQHSIAHSPQDIEEAVEKDELNQVFVIIIEF
jgi:hypothetical protein